MIEDYDLTRKLITEIQGLEISDLLLKICIPCNYALL